MIFVDNPETHFRTYKFRLLPSRKQHQALRAICESQRQLYNAALLERIDCYRKTGKGRNYLDQCKALTELRADPEFSAIPANLQRWTLRRVDEAYQAFFDRVMRGTKAGFPRFRGKGWWKSFGFNEPAGLRFDGHRIRFKGLPGGLRVHLHRPLPEDAEIKSCVFSRDLKGWHVCIQCAVPAEEAEHQGPAIGLAVGVAQLCQALDGRDYSPSPQIARRADRELRRRQRALGRCRSGSVGRRKARIKMMRMHEKMRDSRRTFLHQEIGPADEDVRPHCRRRLTVQPSSRTAKGRSDAAWGNFINFLTYKAESAGGEVIKVNLRKASPTCSRCGAPLQELKRNGEVLRLWPGSRRDYNAALNILALAVTGQGQANVAAEAQGTSS